MFRLNHEIRTKNGEILTPFLVEGTTVYCFGKSGNSIIKTVNDFDYGSEKKDEIIIAQPILEITDEFFEKESILVPPPTIQITPEESKKIIEPLSTEKIKSTVDKGLFSNEEYI